MDVGELPGKNLQLGSHPPCSAILALEFIPDWLSHGFVCIVFQPANSLDPKI
jgi:hypothetical protein